jgi:hypothetical protein
MPELPFDVALIEIGHRKHLGDPLLFAESVKAWKSVQSQPGLRHVVFAVGGYDQDPRDLWDIPEVAEYVFHWMMSADIQPNDQRVHPDSLGLLQACFMRTFGLPFTVVRPGSTRH